MWGHTYCSSFWENAKGSVINIFLVYGVLLQISSDKSDVNPKIIYQAV